MPKSAVHGVVVPRRVLLMISSMVGGGSEQQTLLLLRHLDRSRFEPHLYVLARTGVLMDQVPEDVTVHSFEDIAATGHLYFPGRVLRRQVGHLREVLQRGSIDVVYDRTFHMTMIAGSAAHAIGVPRVSTIVSPPEYALPMVESRFVGLKRRRLSAAYGQARSVVAVSRQAADSAERYYRLSGGSVIVIHNPVDVEAVRAAACGADVAGTMTASEPRLTLVCVGRMSKEKGHSDLISAIALTNNRWPHDTPPLRLRMVGDGPLRSELQDQSVRQAGRHEIEFLGAQTTAAPLIAAADGLVLPSHFEGMPNVVLEAMALGTPVIATRAGGTIELERDEPTIAWAQPNDPESLAAAILSFATDGEGARRRAAAAGRMIEAHHDARLVTRQIEELLAQG